MERKTYKTVCFTGHRKIGAGYEGKEAKALEEFLVKVIRTAYDNGFRTFISGGAVGTDQFAAKAVIRVRNEKASHKSLPGPDDLHLIIARPFATQDANWPVRVQNLFKWLCERSDRVIDVSTGGYSADKMDKRNRFMVDLSEAVIAVWDGRKEGGTYNCVQYALSKGLPILIVHPTRLTATWYTIKQQTHTGGKDGKTTSTAD